jgi:HEAT repeat protein
MELHEISAALTHPDYQYRLQAVSALKAHDAAIAVPMLTHQLKDAEFLVRSQIAMALGKHQTADSFGALLELLKLDNTPNVRAEAANSLSYFGQVSLSHLLVAFRRDSHWLVRRSILAAVMDLNAPAELLELCAEALRDTDLTVSGDAINALANLAGTADQATALAQLLPLLDSGAAPFTLVRLAHALKRFDDPQAQAALAQLRQHPNPKVVAATWVDPRQEATAPLSQTTESGSTASTTSLENDEP